MSLFFFVLPIQAGKNIDVCFQRQFSMNQMCTYFVPSAWSASVLQTENPVHLNYKEQKFLS